MYPCCGWIETSEILPAITVVSFDGVRHSHLLLVRLVSAGHVLFCRTRLSVRAVAMRLLVAGALLLTEDRDEDPLADLARNNDDCTIPLLEHLHHLPSVNLWTVQERTAQLVG
jgi:hypothetical protein